MKSSKTKSKKSKKYPITHPMFWINKKGEHPKVWDIIWGIDVVEDIEDAIDGKWKPIGSDDFEKIKKTVTYFYGRNKPLCIFTKEKDD